MAINANQITKLSSGVIEEEEGVIWLFGGGRCVTGGGGKQLGDGPMGLAFCYLPRSG